MKNKRICLLSILSVFALVGCGGNGGDVTTSNNPSNNKPSDNPIEIDIEDAPAVDMTDDDTIYDDILDTYWGMIDEARDITDNEERYLSYARAEAELLNSNIFMPTSTSGGSYALTHSAYRSTPYVQWGLDSDRVENMVLIKDALVTKAERDHMEKMWNDALKNGTKYDPSEYLVSQGHTLNREYKSVYSAAPQSLDILATSKSSDSVYIVNGLEGLMKYDNLGNQQYAIAKSHTISADKLVYTFQLRDDVNWVKADGTIYGKVTAQDFVTGFRHMLDAGSESGLGQLVSGIVKNAREYMAGKTTDFGKVGMKANGEYELQITLEKEVPYFMTMLTYSTFLPLNETFYRSMGGALGKTEYNTAKNNTANYKYGISSNPQSILYNSAFYFDEITDNNKISLKANEHYYDKANRKIDSIVYVYDNNSSAKDYYSDVINHKYISVTLTDTIINDAKKDGYFEKNAFISSTAATTYLSAINLNRQAYSVSGYPKELNSTKTAEQKEATRNALVNRNFRKALNYAFDRTTWNGAVKGKELATANLRNMYTSPNFLSLEKEVKYTDSKNNISKTFPAKTEYGELVQFFIDEYYGGEIKVADAIDGWYNVDLAKKYIAKAAQELGITADKPIYIDTIVLATETENINQGNIYKNSIEEALKPYVKVNVLQTSDQNAYLSASYYAEQGKDVNYDTYYGSGWGPDFGDPISYLDTFLSNGEGYMTKICGLY